MTSLTVWQLSEKAIEFGPPVPLPSNQADLAWREIAVKFLLYAFAERPLCLIADHERARDWSYTEELPNPTRVRARNATFLVAFADSGSTELFTGLVQSSDFWWDAVWMAPLKAGDVEGVIRLVESVRFKDPTAAPDAPAGQEVILSFGDGCGLWWLNPSKPTAEVDAKLAEIAGSLGWSYHADSGPSRLTSAS